MLIDSHAHLDAPYLAKKLPTILRRADEAGVKEVITIGVTPSSSRKCLQIAAQYPMVHAAAGYHPHWSDGATPKRMAEMEQVAKDPAFIALGEIGLDYRRFRSPKQPQIKLFQAMLEIAASVQLPVIIHDGKAHGDVYQILSGFRSKLAGGIIHCFSGNWALASKYLDWGFFLSIPGPVTYRNARDLREVVCKAPLNRLLLETDAPHLTPAPKKGRNEPAFICHTARTVAQLRKTSYEAVCQATSDNVYQAFNIPTS